MSAGCACLQDDGFVAKILVGEGEKDIAVGTPLLVLVDEEASVSAFKDYSPGQSAGGGAKPAAEAGAPSQEEAEHAPEEASSGAPHGFPEQPDTLRACPLCQARQRRGRSNRMSIQPCFMLLEYISSILPVRIAACIWLGVND